MSWPSPTAHLDQCMDLAPRGWVVATAFWAIWCTRLVLITAVCVYTFLERRFPVAIAEIHSTESVSLARYTYRPGHFCQRRSYKVVALAPPRWRTGPNQLRPPAAVLSKMPLLMSVGYRSTTTGLRASLAAAWRWRQIQPVSSGINSLRLALPLPDPSNPALISNGPN